MGLNKPSLEAVSAELNGYIACRTCGDKHQGSCHYGDMHTRILDRAIDLGLCITEGTHGDVTVILNCDHVNRGVLVVEKVKDEIDPSVIAGVKVRGATVVEPWDQFTFSGTVSVLRYLASGIGKS